MSIRSPRRPASDRPPPRLSRTTAATRGLALASLILGVIGSLVGLTVAFSGGFDDGTAEALPLTFVLPCGLLGLVLGNVAILRQSARGGRKGIALAGLLLSAVVVVLAVVGFAVVGSSSGE